MKPVGDHAALDLVDELEATALRQRLDLDVAVAELAAAAGLLLVAALRLGGALDRLLVGHARRLEGDLGAEAVLHAVHDHLDVHLREPGDDLLAGLRVAVEVDRRVLLLEAAHRGADLVLVALRLRLDRERHHGAGQAERRERDRRLLARRARRRSASPSASRRRRCRRRRTRRRGSSPCRAGRAAGRCAPWCGRARWSAASRASRLPSSTRNRLMRPANGSARVLNT